MNTSPATNAVKAYLSRCCCETIRTDLSRFDEFEAFFAEKNNSPQAV
jgi:hypothetical protein